MGNSRQVPKSGVAKILLLNLRILPARFNRGKTGRKKSCSGSHESCSGANELEFYKKLRSTNAFFVL